MRLFNFLFLLLSVGARLFIAADTLVELERIQGNSSSSNSSSSAQLEDVLKRKRVDDPITNQLLQLQHLSENTDSLASMHAFRETHSESSLVHLWEEETQIAQNEFERLLLNILGSFEPSCPPVPVPSPPAMAPLSTSPTISAPVAPGPTMVAPTVNDCLAGETIETYLFTKFSAVTNDTTLLMNPTSPQGQAFNFTLSDTLINTNICTYPTIEQRYGLAVFYYSTAGPKWFLKTGWLTSTPECTWYGLVCESTGNATLVSTLILPTNNLEGQLPNEISTLYGLTRIDLYNNKITSTFPSGIANLTALNVLDMELNQLTGTPLLDETLLQVTTLNQIFLSSNNFTGTIPDDLNLLTALSSLWLADNEMSGTIPSTIGTIVNMSTLILYGNNFVGTIPSQLGSLSKLNNVQLYSNIFEGSIPDELYNLSELTVLRIDANFLSGTLSTQIGQLTKLSDLRVNDNFLAGTIPDEIEQLKDTRFLIASTNAFEGTIPNLFTDFDSLEAIDLSSNSLTGTIPETLFEAMNLTLVYLNNNLLTGSIPTSFTDVPGIVDLYLDSNQLTGTVPDIPTGTFEDLTELLLQNNKLQGSMPESVCDLRENGVLENLFVDCGGSDPTFECDFPDCCNRCFESNTTSTDRRHRRQQRNRGLLDQKEIRIRKDEERMRYANRRVLQRYKKNIPLTSSSSSSSSSTSSEISFRHQNQQRTVIEANR